MTFLKKTHKLFLQILFNLFSLLGLSDVLIKAIQNSGLYMSYIKTTKASGIKPFSTRECLYKYLMKSIQPVSFNYMEFGVYQGKSIRFFIEHNHHPHNKYFGFDTFYGIPTDWGNRKAGSYSNSGNLPEINDHRLNFLVGTFQEQLPAFLITNKKILANQINIIHLDADVYSSTLFVLIHLIPYLKTGDYILFDEFSFLLDHEFKAFNDFCMASEIKIDLIASTIDNVQTLFEVKQNSYYKP